MSVVAQRWHRADPRPSHCSACLQGAQQGVEFFTNDAAFDRGSIINEETLALVETLDELNLCAVFDDGGKLIGGCAFEFLEAVDYKPQLHARQLTENKQLQQERDEWRETAKRLQAELDRQMRTLFESTEPKRKKVAA